MPWWGWLLVAWAVLGTAAGLWMGAAAGVARRRERVARAHETADAAEFAEQCRLPHGPPGVGPTDAVAAREPPSTEPASPGRELSRDGSVTHPS